MEAELAKNVDKYSKLNTFNIHVASWNVDGKKPIDKQQIDLKSWLLPDMKNPADVLIVGF